MSLEPPAPQLLFAHIQNSYNFLLLFVNQLTAPSMVRLHIKKANDSLFLHDTTTQQVITVSLLILKC